MMLYVLRTPAGVLVERTATTSRAATWGLAFSFLAGLDEEWGRRYWKRLRASQASARRRGWQIVPARLEEWTRKGASA